MADATSLESSDSRISAEDYQTDSTREKSLDQSFDKLSLDKPVDLESVNHDTGYKSSSGMTSSSVNELDLSQADFSPTLPRREYSPHGRDDSVPQSYNRRSLPAPNVYISSQLSRKSKNAIQHSREEEDIPRGRRGIMEVCLLLALLLPRHIFLRVSETFV